MFETFGVNVSTSLICKRRRLNLGWKAQSSNKNCQLISKKNKKVRMQWCMDSLSRKEGFRNVIFVDESCVEMCSSGRLIFHQKSSDIQKKCDRVPKPKHAYKVNVWAGISYRGRTSICIFNGIMDSVIYQQILKDNLLPFTEEKFPDAYRLYQICADMETEYHVFEGIQNLSFSENLNFDENEGLGESGSNVMEFDIGDLSSLMETECEVKKELKESTRFGPVVNDDELKCLVENQENKNTKSNTKWAVKVFESWREQRAGDIIELHLMDTKSMNHWLERFIVEARKKDGSEYPPKTLYLILCGLLRHLRQKGVYDKNFLDEKDIAFVGLRKVLDAKMKSLVDRGLGCEIRQADPIWPEDEEKLWQENVFGKENSEQLQHTMFFYSCKLFGLRACDEHHKLQCEQFSIGNDIHGQFIQFVGRASKTYKGGLGQMNLQTKNLKHYCEPGDRCLAEYFQIYLDALDGAGPFYRRPLPGTSEKPVRYGTQVVGINKLKTFMKSISKKGGLEGNYTNHSGKKTCATQLYIGGVPEAEIMNVTGHRSEQGVRKYMKSNVEMKKSISKILDPPMKQESQEPSSEQTTGGKRALSPCTTNRVEGDAKKLCSESNRALRDLTNTASVFQNCHFNFSFGSN